MDDEKPTAPRPFEGLDGPEKAAAMRAELYITHKNHGSIGTYYQIYPDEQPKAALRFHEDIHGSEQERGR